MGYCEFFPIGIKSLIVRFDCDHCGSEVTSEEIKVPTADINAERARDSHGENYGWGVCEECDKAFNISVYVGWTDAYIDIDDIDDESISIEAIEYESDYFTHEQIDTIIQSEVYISKYQTEISNLRKLNEIEISDYTLQQTLQRQIYSGAITCLEDYLSTTLIQRVLNDEDHFKMFVKTYKNIKKMRFDLSEIYEKFEDLRDIVKMELAGVIYHDLRKVRGMYLDAIGIQFPPIEDLIKIINNRHDMVHRNGKNKEGEKIEMSSLVVSDVIDKVSKFVESIENEINKLP